jgi:hypothetical protein
MDCGNSPNPKTDTGSDIDPIHNGKPETRNLLFKVVPQKALDLLPRSVRLKLWHPCKSCTGNPLPAAMIFLLLIADRASFSEPDSATPSASEIENSIPDPDDTNFV